MKCDKCENEATVHELRVVSGKRHEMHLCESCAKAQGLAPQMLTPLTALLGGPYVTHQAAAAPAAQGGAAGTGAAPAAVTVCPSCSTSYAQFRSSGILGCPTCYTVFEPQLTPLLARAHESGTHHAGKSPRGLAEEKGAGVGAAAKAHASRSTTDAKALAERIAQLKKRLAEAVTAEQYEKAAKLRDDLARLEGKGKPARGHDERAEGKS